MILAMAISAYGMFTAWLGLRIGKKLERKRHVISKN